VIVGIGIDIVEVQRIRRALRRSEETAKRIFTAVELEYCLERRNKYQHFAGRFAAKEAAFKALGTGWQKGIRWQDVEVVAEKHGRPSLRFYGRAGEFLEALGVKRGLVTISHTSEYAVAAVVLDTQQGEK
jgi:holo-[acyl-carrier protein] synthase